MEISVRSVRLSSLKTQALGVPVRGNPRRDQLLKTLDSELGGALLRLVKEEKFSGKPGQRLIFTSTQAQVPTRILLFGIGKANHSTATQVRTFAHKFSSYVREKGLSRYAIAAPQLEEIDETTVVQWLTEGARSGVYRFDELLTGDRKPKKKPSRCSIVFLKDGELPQVSVTKALREGVAVGNAIADGVELARDLVNTPANMLSPEGLASRAEELAQELDLEITIEGEDEIRKRGMGLIDAVGRGSATPPRFAHLIYRPAIEEPAGVVALVGKGVTYDSGGLSLKTSKGMIDMKCDMGGAAVVLGAMKALAQASSDYEIHGLLPMVENMPSGTAYRPGDVFKSLDGKTVEVLNTDAEGRLILADALSYAKSLDPDIIMDFATLTGACMVALGPYRAAIFGTDDDWAEAFEDAARRAGEAFWRLPLAQELREGLRSPIADLRNIGGSWGGAITAALFLKEFVGKTPWLHLDIAGPAYLDKPRGFYPKGGTGFCVLTLAELLRKDSSG